MNIVSLLDLHKGLSEPNKAMLAAVLPVCRTESFCPWDSCGDAAGTRTRGVRPGRLGAHGG